MWIKIFVGLGVFWVILTNASATQVTGESDKKVNEYHVRKTIRKWRNFTKMA
jgi:hypothetical protein